MERLKRMFALSVSGMLVAALVTPTAVGAAVGPIALGGETSQGAQAVGPLATDDDIPGIPAPASPIIGELDAAGDTDDVYRIDLAPGQVLVASITGPAGTDFDLFLYGPEATSILDGVVRARAITEVYPDELNYRAEVGGTHYLDASADVGSGEYSITYRVMDADSDVPGVPAPASPILGGTLDADTDTDDVFSINLAKDQTLTASITGPAGTDFDLWLYPPGTKSVHSDSEVASATLEFVYPDEFTYKATSTGTYYLDAFAYFGSGAYTITYSVAAPNTAPVAVADTYSTAHNTPLVVPAPGVLGNDSDGDGDPLTALKVTNPSHGSVTLNANGSFTYTPHTGYSGPDSFTYRAYDGKAHSASVTVSIAVGAPVVTYLSLSSSSATPKYDAAVTLSASLVGNGAGMSGQTVVFERQSGTSWLWVGSAVTGSNGVAAISVKPYDKAKTTYRARFAGAATYAASVSASLIVTPQVHLTKGNAPTTMYKGKAKTITGYLKPRHTSGSTSTVRIYRYKRTSSGVYKKVDYVKTKLGNYSSFSKYTKSFSFPSKGKWRIRAYHPADSKHAATWSSYDYVTVK